MKRRSTLMAGLCGLLMTMAAVCGQSAPAARTQPDAPPPKNIDRALDELLSVDADDLPLAKFIDLLRQRTQTNIVPNWNALGKGGGAGVTRETPVTLHLKELTYEHVIRTLVEVLPQTAGTKVNYAVGDNTLELTTNADLGKGSVTQLYPLSRVMELSREEGAGGGEKVIESVLREVLVRAGEPLGGAAMGGGGPGSGHAMAIRAGTLAATVSERGQTILTRATGMLSTPVKPGQYAPGTAVTATAKRGQEALTKATADQTGPALYLAMARDPAKYSATVNLALLSGTKEELARPAPRLEGTVTDGGVVLIGPRGQISARTVFAAYDLRDLIKKFAAKSTQRPAPASANLQATIIKSLQEKVPVEAGWGTDPGRSDAAMIPFNGMLLVFATVDQQRAVTMGLQELGR